MEEDITKSLFNEASLKMARLDKAQTRISESNLNPLAYNHNIEKYGYQIIITELNNLVSEVWGKLDSKAKLRITKLRGFILDLLELKPIHIEGSNNGISGHKQTMVINKDNWRYLRDILFKYHMEINVLLEKAGYSTFSDESMGDLLE